MARMARVRTPQGLFMSWSQLCREAGINYYTFKARYEVGWSIVDALTEPVGPVGRRRKRKVTSDGETISGGEH